MVVISTRDFRANQTKFLNLAQSGEDVILKSRSGSFRLTPVEEENKHDLTEDLIGALRQVRDHLDGKIKLHTLDEVIDEL